mmetsp:Transcript_28776/g.52928  ORF Transcript_28776/g.52928 Transcript_28776/m.52928 type:complete len:96 (+) Transcript_28776:150-437(+)
MVNSLLPLVKQETVDELQTRIEATCVANSSPSYARKYGFLQEVVKVAMKQYFPRILVAHTIPTKDIDPASVTYHYIHGLEMNYLTEGELMDAPSC